MAIALSLSLLFFGIGVCVEGPQQPSWVNELLGASKLAPAIEKSVKPHSGKTAGSHGDNSDGRIGPEDPVISERYHAVSVASRVVGRLYQLRRAEDAFEHLSYLWKNRPELEIYSRHTYIEAAILTKRYDEAYKHLLIKARDATLSERSWLLLAVASAARGEIYAGQAEFCENMLAKICDEQHYGIVPFRRAKIVNDPKFVLSRALTTLGMKGGPGHLYLEMALQVDPANTLAASEAIARELFKGQYSQARKIGLAILDGLPAGPERDSFIANLETFKDARDEPLQLLPLLDGQ